ncbi:PLP-dependent aminotransferase family protein [Sphingomonas oleivorans]|uniref:MocR-like pyridoxine biosynthesis transcription factor PdxR n=1 Tax=Sphingomonas oleivorans TaxID=1735121 RepID=UPI0013FD34DA|nr:PLP-dependent aminotransferase family protein [Sphingomonas oleivorans]
MNLELKPDSRVPIYQQLFGQLRGMILNGELASGTRLPATREIAKLIQCSRSTVLLAFEMLMNEGYVEARQGSGTYVVDTVPEDAIGCRSTSAAPDKMPAGVRLSTTASALLDLDIPKSLLPHSRVIFPDVREFPFGTWSALFRSAWKQPEADLLGPHDPMGYLPLRRVIADYLRDIRGLICDPEQIAITSGTSHGLNLLFQLLLSPGDQVVLEDPSAPWMVAKAIACGAQPLFIPVDGEGICLDANSEAASGARLAVVTPSHQFPLGYVLSQRRRTALLNWAQRNDAWIIEDDFDSEFRFAGRPLPPLYTADQSCRVFYMATFSKILIPNIRLGYIVLPPQFVESYSRLRAIVDRYTSLQLQPVVASFIEDGHYASHLRRMRALYEGRQNTLLALAERYLPELLRFEPQDGGMHSVGWLLDSLPHNISAARLADLANKAGIPLSPLSTYCHRFPRPEAVLFGYARYSQGEISYIMQKLADLTGCKGREAG